VNIKMNDFVGNLLQNKFYPCCYILLSDTRPKRRCTPFCGAAMVPRCHWCRNPGTTNGGARRGHCPYLLKEGGNGAQVPLRNGIIPVP